MSAADATLPPDLVERVLHKLGFDDQPEPTLASLRRLYAAWGQGVPFDNIRKLIHLREGHAGPLPGDDAIDFLQSWLSYGTGGTCWAGHTALHALLDALGFDVVRGYGTMLVAPDLPPNHATVVVACEQHRYLVDASILHGEPLELPDAEASHIRHPSWGVSADVRNGRVVVRWRPIHMPEGLDCRIDQLDVPASTFREFHEGSRAWSPFNYELYARVNRGDTIIGAAFGRQIEFDAAGTPHSSVLPPSERMRFLVERLGIDEALAARVPADIPTPPPPRPGAAA